MSTEAKNCVDAVLRNADADGLLVAADASEEAGWHRFPDVMGRVIRLQRQDDAHRLRLAAYWDANGDPERGEFIRVQCRLARERLAFPVVRGLRQAHCHRNAALGLSEGNVTLHHTVDWVDVAGVLHSEYGAPRNADGEQLRLGDYVSVEIDDGPYPAFWIRQAVIDRLHSPGGPAWDVRFRLEPIADHLRPEFEAVNGLRRAERELLGYGPGDLALPPPGSNYSRWCGREDLALLRPAFRRGLLSRVTCTARAWRRLGRDAPWQVPGLETVVLSSWPDIVAAFQPQYREIAFTWEGMPLCRVGAMWLDDERHRVRTVADLVAMVFHVTWGVRLEWAGPVPMAAEALAGLSPVLQVWGR